MSGYVSDVSYTLGFYRELSPSFLRLACIQNGIEGPDAEGPLRYCELGCGRGYGTLLLAAANPNAQFVGIDFNPAHVAEARGLAARAKIPNIDFFEMSFADAARSQHPALAAFDIVVMHGVYTWVERSVRSDIHQFIRDKLIAGGLVYNSYNSQPGWATVHPIQHLMMEVSRRSSRDSLSIITEAQRQLKSLVEHSSAFVTQNPGVKSRLERMESQDRAYLAHEFLNSGWEPLFITDVMRDFSESKLTYIGSATLLENRLDLCVPKQLQDTVRDAPDAAMRELLKDYAINKQFRRDLYVKGPQKLSQFRQRQSLGRLPFVVTAASAKPPETFQIPLGEVKPNTDAAAKAFTAFENGGICTASEFFTGAEKQQISESDALLLLLFFVNSALVAPARIDHQTVDRGPSHRVNGLVMEMSALEDSHRFLASPVLGSALATPFLDRIVGSFAAAGDINDIAIAEQAFDRLGDAGQSFRRDGLPMKKTEENVSTIAGAVADFQASRLPVWRRLGIV